MPCRTPSSCPVLEFGGTRCDRCKPEQIGQTGLRAGQLTKSGIRQEASKKLSFARHEGPPTYRHDQKKGHERSFGIEAFLDGIQNAPQAMVTVGDLAIIAGFGQARPAVADVIRPNRIAHPGNVVVGIVPRCAGAQRSHNPGPRVPYGNCRIRRARKGWRASLRNTPCGQRSPAGPNRAPDRHANGQVEYAWGKDTPRSTSRSRQSSSDAPSLREAAHAQGTGSPSVLASPADAKTRHSPEGMPDGCW